MKKDTKFIKCDSGIFCVRKEEIIDNGKRKIVAFAIADIDVGINKDTDFDKIAEEILNKEKNNFGEGIALYEWDYNNFRKVEDIKNQTWFVF